MTIRTNRSDVLVAGDGVQGLTITREVARVEAQQRALAEHGRRLGAVVLDASEPPELDAQRLSHSSGSLASHAMT